ncbi:hypothetical protein DRQ33_02600 [bacterium]|nr:MAG: hypothetical protein DRQ33_02600 [bacterium]
MVSEKELQDKLEQTKMKLERCEELLRLRTRQLFFLMKVSQQIAHATSLKKQLKIIAQGIIDARLFRRAIISIFGRNWKRKNVGYAGIKSERIKEIKKNKPLPSEIWEKILTKNYQVSESYYIPHDDPLNEEIGGIAADTSEEEFDGWHPNDYLFVPLHSHTGRIIGIISVDDPFDGNKPTPHSDTLLLLELFAREAAELIERNQLLKKLCNQRAYLRKLINSSADIIVTTNERGRIRIFNPAAQEIFGYNLSEIRGRSVLNLYADPDQAHRVMKKMRKSHGHIKNEEVEIITKSGEKFPISLSASILYDEHHREIGTVGVSRDLRPIKELEQAKRLSTISKIAITLSHYTRTHLMAQVAVLYNLLIHTENIQDKKLKNHFYNGIHKSVQRAIQIGKIMETFQNPPENIEEEKYIEGLEMFALLMREDIILEDLEIVEIPPVNILVVDDEKDIREGVAQFLNSFLFEYDMEVDTAENGEDAIQKINSKHYDLVLTDLKMGEKSGLDVYKCAKDKHSDTEVIVMTAFHYLCEDTRHRLLGQQLRDLKRENVFIVDKPFDFIALLKRIAGLFRDRM